MALVAKYTMTHWIFGYGSLIWRADFPYHERHTATIRGWTRRFWQGSHDHRGTPEAPGRVVTLIPDASAHCIGTAYRVDEGVFAHLDYREKNGYERVVVNTHFLPASHHLHNAGVQPASARTGQSVRSVTYIAPANNPAFLGAASTDAIAAHIFQARGPSGTNADYLLALAHALEDLGAEDDHVRDLASRVLALTATTRLRRVG